VPPLGDEHDRHLSRAASDSSVPDQLTTRKFFRLSSDLNRMPQRFIFQPFKLGLQGGVAVTDDPNRHLRDKVLAVLFTAAGERVNRPDFGVGLNRAVFETLDEIRLAALKFHVSQGLNRELGDEFLLDNVDLIATPERGELEIHIEYRRRTDRIPRTLEIKL
jgi:phage baseplate assembly protein W